MAGLVACRLLRRRVLASNALEALGTLEIEWVSLERNLLEIFRSLKLDSSFLDVVIRHFSGSIKLLRRLCAQRDFVRLKQEEKLIFQERTSLPLMSFFGHMLNKCPDIFVFVYTRQLINDELLQRLTRPLHMNRSLQVLNLSQNLITDRGAESLATMLRKNKALRCLFLAENKITSFGLEALLKALLINKTLKILDLERNKISPEALMSICFLLGRNKANFGLLELKLAGNLISEEQLDFLNQIFKNSLKEKSAELKLSTVFHTRTVQPAWSGLLVHDSRRRKEDTGYSSEEDLPFG
jgi:hypothetical protein